ncbi:23S rRNA (adenine(2503)-C(2))-methyltransferase RlmN [Tomitella fengzijianii]|uniref:Probable dual-specificity RNA methyltransferase RlmN n=1 Tax=Tomitella fengzijianii TaxID=2597660 RepID=A0A516X3N4_9ACTN|nr:23S rRNA (adenine(2503)-C(2))-methyltransferase RlmN [Tomitella fengzijianii]QDQ97685.1 23S rRNA (adenine(2503)-C(2))-methyltransferase RlmN [Tomitella fengzijianii]
MAGRTQHVNTQDPSAGRSAPQDARSADSARNAPSPESPGTTGGSKPVRLVFSAPRRGLPPTHLADLDADGRKAAMGELGLPKFRADQIARQYYGRLVADPAEMTDLPAAMRESVSQALFPPLLTAVRNIACDDGTTRKTLWRAGDGTLLESVLMRYPDRATLCISSQAGCGMACPFCATGQGGLDRNLSTAEIVDQVRAAAAAMRDGEVHGGPGRLSNIVFMGMGEPLANYKRVVAAVRRITDPAPDGFGLSQRSVTVSTVGLAPAIRKLADEGLAVTLAVSLHTPDDELRDTLVPVNNRWSVAEVLDAARYYADRTGRRVSIEYALIRDVNDQPWRADLLAKKLRAALGALVHVNLIPLNPTPGSEWDAAPKPVEREFVRRVRAAGVSCTVRDTRGQEIAAACGQLAATEK